MIGPFHTNRPAFGDALELARQLPDESVHCIVTSPPYWGLRDYGVEGQLGLEKTPEEYVERLVEIFQELRRALRADGTLWLNLGDCYANQGTQQPQKNLKALADRMAPRKNPRAVNCDADGEIPRAEKHIPPGLKPKDLVGVPWRVAFALQADGWYLRSDIIWSKPNPMPESVTDRPTKAHEYLFLLSKSERYYYDGEAVREPSTERASGNTHRRLGPEFDRPDGHRGASVPYTPDGTGRNRRTVWTVPTVPYPGAHFATFPPDLIKPCILAGCPAGGIVLDPFLGSGTTGQVCQDLGRGWIGFELNPDYALLIKKRTKQLGLFMEAK